MRALRTYFYVDAFNLYYRALKGTPHKRLDLDAPFRRVFPRHEVERIKYFTAHVKALPHDPQQPVRQQVYLRALRTLPAVSIDLGQFASHTVKMPLASTLGSSTRFAEVWKSEEKGSDVNLAAHLVHDAHQGAFEHAVIVTNDSDLIEPVRIVVCEVGLPVGVLNPSDHPAGGLRKAATFYRTLRHAVLAASQFPDALRDDVGEFHKPTGW